MTPDFSSTKFSLIDRDNLGNSPHPRWNGKRHEWWKEGKLLNKKYF